MDFELGDAIAGQMVRIMAKQYGGAPAPWRHYFPVLTR